MAHVLLKTEYLDAILQDLRILLARGLYPYEIRLTQRGYHNDRVGIVYTCEKDDTYTYITHHFEDTEIPDKYQIHRVTSATVYGHVGGLEEVLDEAQADGYFKLSYEPVFNEDEYYRRIRALHEVLNHGICELKRHQHLSKQRSESVKDEFGNAWLYISMFENHANVGSGKTSLILGLWNAFMNLCDKQNDGLGYQKMVERIKSILVYVEYLLATGGTVSQQRYLELDKRMKGEGLDTTMRD